MQFLMRSAAGCEGARHGSRQDLGRGRRRTRCPEQNSGGV